MAKKKIDLSKGTTSIQCFCSEETKIPVIGAKDLKDCTCIMIDGQGLADDVRVDRVILSELGIKTPEDRRKPPFISTRTLKGVEAKEVTGKDPKFINLEEFKIE